MLYINFVEVFIKILEKTSARDKSKEIITKKSCLDNKNDTPLWKNHFCHKRSSQLTTLCNWSISIPLETENLWFSYVFRGYRKRSQA